MKDDIERVERRQLAQHEKRESDRSKKGCYLKCRICGMCYNHSSLFQECSRCYPPSQAMEQVLHKNYHCRCKHLSRMGTNRWGQYTEIHHRD
jgi:hypothetical protein